MCNLYSLTKSQDAIRRITKAMRDTHRQPAAAPRHLPRLRRPRSSARPRMASASCFWPAGACPRPPSRSRARRSTRASPTSATPPARTGGDGWCRASRCLVPFTSFSENDKGPDGKAVPVWFALDEERPLAFFAGIWTTWTSTRKLAEGEVTLDLFGFLTTDANAGGRGGSPEGHAGDPHPRGGPGDVDGSALAGGGEAATAFAGRGAPDRDEG